MGRVEREGIAGLVQLPPRPAATAAASMDQAALNLNLKGTTMKRAILVASALALSACQTPALTDTAPAVAVGQNVLVLGTNALADAADAYTVVANAAAVAVRAGLLNNDQLVQLRDLNNRAAALLSGASTGLTTAQRAAELTAIVGQLRTIAGGK